MQYYPRSKKLVCDHDRSSEGNDNECGFCKIDYKEDEYGFSVPRVTSGFSKNVSKNRFSFHVDDFPLDRNFHFATFDFRL